MSTAGMLEVMRPHNESLDAAFAVLYKRMNHLSGTGALGKEIASSAEVTICL